MADRVDARVPAHDLEAEGALLSALLFEPEGMAKVAPIVRPEAFYAEAHRRIFEAALALWSEGKPVDVVHVQSWLREHGRLEQVGGSAYLTEVLNAAPALAHLEAYAELVARKARVRQLQGIAMRVVAEAYQPIEDEDAFIDRVEQAVHELGAARAARLKVDTMRSVLHTVFAKIQERNERGETGPTGTPTGFTALDDATGGLHDGESTIIAARPGMGKTALVMNMASHVASLALGVVVFSLEMPNEQIATRALCSSARVDVRKARTNMFDITDWRSLTNAVQREAKPEHYYLYDKPSGLLEMRSVVRSRASDMARAGVKLGLVAVDYVQLMLGREGVRSREEAVSENARGLKLLAKEVGAPVVVLSQLNRGVESRDNKRPMLSDLRESGALEEAADCVIGLYRDDYYDEESKTPGIAEAILLKHRHGPTGSVELGFEAKSTTFYNLREECA